MQAGRIIFTAALLLCGATAAQAAGEKTLVRTPELVVKHGPASETCAFPADSYSDFKLEGETATFTLDGRALPAGSRKLSGGGMREVSWVPADKSTQVTIQFAAPPQSSLLNAVPGTPDRPHTAQVVAGFLFAPGALKLQAPGSAALGARPQATGEAGETSQPGSYDLPKFAPVHYSDALVSMNVKNADFRDILFQMSRIGNVSIMLDPYYDDEPTGNKRTGKGGGTGGEQGGGNGFGNGPGGLFPRDNTGFITLNFKDVPFDQALDLLLQSAGLVKADVYPNG
jgi:hypothetical protein